MSSYVEKIVEELEASSTAMQAQHGEGDGEADIATAIYDVGKALVRVIDLGLSGIDQALREGMGQT